MRSVDEDEERPEWDWLKKKGRIPNDFVYPTRRKGGILNGPKSIALIMNDPDAPECGFLLECSFK